MPPAGYRPPIRECAAAGCPRTARISRQLCSKHARLHAKRKVLHLKEGRCLGHIPRDMKLELKSASSSVGATSFVEVPSDFSSSSSASFTRKSPRELRNIRYNVEEEDEEEVYNSEGDQSEDEEEDTLTMDTYTVSIGGHKKSSSPAPSSHTTPSPSRLSSPCSSPSVSPLPASFFIPLPTSSSIESPITKEKRQYRKKNKKSTAEKFQALTEAVLEAVATDFDLQTFEASVQARRNSISNPINIWASLPALQRTSSPSSSLPFSTQLTMAALPTRLPSLSLPPLSSFTPLFQSSHITLCNPTAASTTTIALERGVSAM